MGMSISLTAIGSPNAKTCKAFIAFPFLKQLEIDYQFCQTTAQKCSQKSDGDR
jgi:hypothetical protein